MPADLVQIVKKDTNNLPYCWLMTVRLELFAKIEFSCFHSPDVVINNTRILVWAWSTSLKDSYDRRRLKYIYLWVRFPSFQSFRKTKIKCRKSVLSKQAKMNVKTKNSSLLKDNGRKKNIYISVQHRTTIQSSIYWEGYKRRRRPQWSANDQTTRWMPN